MKSQAFYKLKIVAGLHKDAELFLEQGIQYAIGSSDDCDIILLDSGVEKKHLSFTISKGKILLENTGAELFVDGKQAPYTAFELSKFQVVSIGDAHITIGPGTEIWPVIALPQVEEEDDDEPLCLDLVPVDKDGNLPSKVLKPGIFQTIWHAFRQWMNSSDKKILAAVGTFVLAFMFFVVDAWFTSAPKKTVVHKTPNIEQTSETIPTDQRKGMLLTAIDGLLNIQKNTLVGAGLAEPVVPIESGAAKPAENPVDQIRIALKKNWGSNLTETRNSQNDIQFKGFDEQNRQNLALNIEQNDQGEIRAEGIAGTLKMKKAILSQMGDLIRIKVDVSEDMENVCERVLKKKGIRQANAQFDIKDNAFTLEGSTKDKKTISSVRDIVAKAFPQIKINNEIKLNRPRPKNTGRINISSVSTSGAPHIILKDGSRIFRGGRLDNGCTIIGIENDCVTLNCNGTKKKHKL